MAPVLLLAISARITIRSSCSCTRTELIKEISLRICTKSEETVDAVQKCLRPSMVCAKAGAPFFFRANGLQLDTNHVRGKSLNLSEAKCRRHRRRRAGAAGQGIPVQRQKPFTYSY
jgi:hypothetical protein